MEMVTMQRRMISEDEYVDLNAFVDHNGTRSFSVSLHGLGGTCGMIHTDTIGKAYEIFKPIADHATGV